MRSGLRARRGGLWGANSPPAHYTGISGEYFTGKTIRPRGDRNIANRCLGLVRGLPPPGGHFRLAAILSGLVVAEFLPIGQCPTPNPATPSRIRTAPTLSPDGTHALK